MSNLIDNQNPIFTREQALFKELLVGTLIYVSVLGFLNDYTDVAYAASFSYLFYAAFVLEVLTFLTLLAKKAVFSRYSKQASAAKKTKILFGTWLILFLSKFVFIGVIDFAFDGKVAVYGFFNILLVVALVTLLHRLIDHTFTKLGTEQDRSVS